MMSRASVEQAGMSEVSYTADEMMTVSAARVLRDGMTCFVGIGLPSSAANLARATHAPSLVLIYESGTIGAKPAQLPLSIGDGMLAVTADAVVSVPEIFNYWLQPGRIDIGFLGAAQIDKFGNINTTVIGGDYGNPKVRLPGAGGAPEIAASCREVIVVIRQSRRSFVERVDFVTSVGYGSGPGDRERLGLTGAGPKKIITDLGILEPDPETLEFTLTGLYPGVAAPAVKERTGWDLAIASDPEIIVAPTPAEPERAPPLPGHASKEPPMTERPGASPVLQGGVSPEVAVSPACHSGSAASSWDSSLVSGDNHAAGMARDREVLRVPQGMGHGASDGAARVSPPLGGSGNHPQQALACPGIPALQGREDVNADVSTSLATPETGKLVLPSYERPAGLHPPLDSDGYRSTALRHPKQPLVLLPHRLTEVTGPLLGADLITPADSDLTTQRDGEPQGQRIILTGQVLDSGGRPVPDTLIEIWQTNAAGRYRHSREHHPAPLDPNFDGIGRAITDSAGRYRFVTIAPGAYPWGNHHNAWRPGAYPFLAVRARVHPAARHPDVFSWRPAAAARPDLQLGARREGQAADDRRLRHRADPARMGPRLPLGHRAARPRRDRLRVKGRNDSARDDSFPDGGSLLQHATALG